MGEGRADRAGKLQKAIDHLVHVVMELRRADEGDDTGLCLGDLIKRERVAWGLTLQDLADRCGLTKSHVWELEVSRSFNPSTKAIAAIAEALRLPPIQVLNAALTSIRILGELRPTPSKDKADG